MLNLVTAIPFVRPEDVRLSIDELAREGARRMLMEALQAEVADYIDVSGPSAPVFCQNQT